MSKIALVTQHYIGLDDCRVKNYGTLKGSKLSLPCGAVVLQAPKLVRRRRDRACLSWSAHAATRASLLQDLGQRSIDLVSVGRQLELAPPLKVAPPLV